LGPGYGPERSVFVQASLAGWAHEGSVFLCEYYSGRWCVTGAESAHEIAELIILLNFSTRRSLRPVVKMARTILQTNNVT
jgi:hypothetical protein